MSPSTRYTTADRTPFDIGYRPVAIALHTGSACVGRSVARCRTDPLSMMRAMLGRRPAATDDRITSSDAPSNISMRMCESDASVAPSTTVGGSGTRRLACRAAGHDRRRHRQHHRRRQNRGADSSAAAAEMREPEAEKDHRGGRDQRGAHEHPIARDRIEHVAEAAEVEPHQRRRGAGRDRAQPRQQPHAQPARRQHFHRENLPHHDQRVERDGQVGAVGHAEDQGQRQQRGRIDRYRRIELKDERRQIAGGHTRGNHRVRQHPQVAHRLKKDVPYLD